MDADQMAASDPILHQMPGKPLGKQLTTSNDAVLPPGYRRQRPVDKGALCRSMRY
jgi:hypothetical protein